MGQVPDAEELIETPPPGAPLAGTEKPHDPYAPFRLREYRFYLFGNLAANMGSSMQSVAVGWELYERTGSAMALAWVGLVQALPIMLLALPAGQLADRLDRRRIVLFGLLVMAMASLGLAIVSHQRGSVEWMYAMLFFGASGRAFFLAGQPGVTAPVGAQRHSQQRRYLEEHGVSNRLRHGTGARRVHDWPAEDHHVGVYPGCSHGPGELLLRGGNHRPSHDATGGNRFAQNLVGRLSIRAQ